MTIQTLTSDITEDQLRRQLLLVSHAMCWEGRGEVEVLVSQSTFVDAASSQSFSFVKDKKVVVPAWGV